MKNSSGIFNRTKRLFKNNAIVKHSSILFVTQTIASIIALVITSLQVKSLGMATYGIIAVVAAYATFFDGLLNFQSYNAVIKYGTDALVENNIERLRNYYTIAILQDLITAVIAFLLGHLLLNYASILLNWSQEITKYARIYLIVILFNLVGCANAGLRLNDRFEITGIISIVTNIAKLILTIIFIVFDLHFVYFLLLEIGRIFVSNFLTLFLFMITTKKKYGVFPFKKRIKFDKTFTKFNVYNNLVSTVDTPTGQFVSLIISRYLGLDAVGIYSILSKLGSIITKITLPVSQSMLPEVSLLVSSKKDGKAWNIGKKMFCYVNILGVIAIAGLLILSPLWMGFFMDLSLDNIVYFSLYAYYILFTASVIGIHAFFIAKNYVKANLFISIVCDAIYLVALFISIQFMGLFGVLISLLFQAIVVIIFKIIYYHNKKRKEQYAL